MQHPEPKSPTPRYLSTVNITFLGTGSSATTLSRHHPSLALRLNGDVWLFDCGEATQHQIIRSSVKLSRISKVFITHTHSDHIYGLVPLITSKLSAAGGNAEEADGSTLEQAKAKKPLEIYGPLGTRAFIRSCLLYTHTSFDAQYVVHELRLPTDPQDGDYTALTPQSYELPGRNITQSPEGTWPDIFSNSVLSVSSAPIMHTVPCVGFVVDEKLVPGKMDASLYIAHLKRTNTPMTAMTTLRSGGSVTLSDGMVLQGPALRPGRRIVILGDTYDPSPIIPLAQNADLLIHEASNAHLPKLHSATKRGDTYESVQARTISHGHSTPQMAGAFAAKIGARKLVLNHFSARYLGIKSKSAMAIMDRIGDLAKEHYQGSVVCARDLMSFDVPLREP